jgi:hypothetical protein
MYAVGRDSSEFDASIILTTKIIHLDLSRNLKTNETEELYEGKICS